MEGANCCLIKYIEEKYDGTLIIPMTIVNPEYFKEIVGLLRNKGIEVKHFTLMASKKTLLRRLKSRGDGAGSWGAKQIDRCLVGLSNEVFNIHIDTENTAIDEVAEKIAQLSNITLLPDNTSKFRKFFYRLCTQLKHIRIVK